MNPYERLPDLTLLVACGVHAAKAMGQREADEAKTRVFFEDILHGNQRQGRRDIWGCLTEGLITEVEARNGVMARFATWLSCENKMREPSASVWCSSDSGFGVSVG